ncbi:MAG: universal stress protein [Acidobacteriota bacterium]|nr:universal stress protein [Acidobacteriota bacterium]
MKVLLAFDDSPCSRAALEAVIRQFAPATATVRVLHAMDWPNELTMAESFVHGSQAAAEISALQARRRQESDALAASAAARLSAAGFAADTVVYDGGARDAILDETGRWQPDVIVLGSHGRRGLDRLLLGSVAESVVHRASCSVEVVRAPACTEAAGAREESRAR